MDTRLSLRSVVLASAIALAAAPTAAPAQSGVNAAEGWKLSVAVGPAFALAGTVFIDRSDRTKAIEALAPAVEALHQGLSIAIAPEGTRSATGRLSRFRKGAFHLAMQARVPLVPIVFRNTLDVLPKHGLVVRAGTVEVIVHPPIPTADWTPRQLDARIGEVERLYEETLRA